LGSLNGRGLVRFGRFGRDFGFVCFGMGKGLGFGWRFHTASATTSLTSILHTCYDGVMQNHQAETISTWPQFSAAQKIRPAEPISDNASR
jgi:hypothetical protein